MQHRPRTYVVSAALAATLTGALAGCGSSDGDGAGGDTKPGTSGNTSAEAEPGRYNTLPEPCGSVNRGTLKKLLPGANSADSGNTGRERKSPYDGEAKLTYDTDRLVGCNWKSATPEGSRHLSVRMERVVSYDGALNDDEQAQQLYDRRKTAANIPSSGDDAEDQDNQNGQQNDGEDGGQDTSSDGPTPSDGASNASPSSGNTDEQGGDQHADRGGQRARQSPDTDGGTDGSDQPSDTPSSSTDPSAPEESTGPPSDELAPRTLDDISDNAYINDQLDTGHSGVHRDITLVFRSSNVIVTVGYDQWAADKNQPPDSAELQDNAQQVAQELATEFDEQ